MAEDGSGEGVGPSGALSFASDGDFGSCAPEDVEGEFSDDCEVFGAVVLSISGAIFVEVDVEDLTALVAHVKVAPQSGSALFIWAKATEMHHIGMKARMVTIGACTPIATTTKPSVAAMLYAGAVEATAMTTLEIRPARRSLIPSARTDAPALRSASRRPP